MSRLPTLSTPGRLNGSPTGIPTPTHRRARVSLGPGQTHPSSMSSSHSEMDQALQEVLRKRPPSSLSRASGIDDDPPSTPAPNSSFFNSERSERVVPAPRTPGFRPRTPSANAPVTPVARPAPRPSLAGRSGLSASTTTPRRPSMASSTTSTTPFARRPESRATTHEAKWTPAVGDRVRLPSHGYEGTLRYLGETHIREGIWAGVELEGGFQGKGRNDGSVDGVKYFECGENCGIFTLAEKLAAPTTGPSRPGSVMSHRSLASSSYSVSGRATPAAERVRRGAGTPGPTSRSTSARLRQEEDPDGTPTDTGRRTLLGNSTSTNAVRPEAKITAGSRASKYLGMTAKQLDSARHGVVPRLNSSTSATPKVASRISLGVSTPSRAPRPSIGGSLATPKARPRMSTTMEMMPPPPSPQRVTPPSAAATAAAAALEEELNELRQRNAVLEEQLAGLDLEGEQRVLEELKTEVERVKEEADSLRYQLSAEQVGAGDVRKRADELESAESALKAELEAKEKELSDVKREMKLAAERASGELEAGMEAKRDEVRRVEERAEAAEIDLGEMKRLVDELTLAGTQIIELNESKQFTFESRIRELEEQLDKATEDVTKARAEAERLAALVPEAPAREATAAEIDNETLTAQVKHLQNRISHLEETIEETRGQAETESDAWQAKYAKAREAERAVDDDLQRVKSEVARLNDQGAGAKSRIEELQGALKENQAALEGARAEIETLRVDAAEAASMRAAAQNAAASERALAESQTEVTDLRAQLAEREADVIEHKAELTKRQTQIHALTSEIETKVATLDAEITALKQAAAARSVDSPGSPKLSDSVEDRIRPRLSLGGSSVVGGVDDAERSIRGYRHIVQEMTTENAQLKSKQADLVDEIAMLKEEIKLLQDINESESEGTAGPSSANGATAKELADAKAAIGIHVETIKDLEREVSELESLIESKIYNEDALENRIQRLEHDVDRWRAKALSSSSAVPSLSSHSRSTSIGTSASEGASSRTSALDETRCELCEGPHDLDACPVFSGATLDGADGSSPLAAKRKKWCADCESSEHETADCPMAEDVF